MKFEIIMEDGGIYKQVIILSSRGIARNKRDVLCALKYEGFITIYSSSLKNQKLIAKDIYEIVEKTK